jgi:acetyl esterase
MDGTSIGLIGFSGGATLAAAAAIRSAAGEIPALKGVVLHYPYLDSVHMPSEKEHFDCDMDPAVMSAFTKLYSREEERSLPLVSPICATEEELKNFAPTMVIPAEKDALRKEGLLFADKLREAGVSVYCRVMPDVHHGYIEDAGNIEFFDAVTLDDTKKTLSPFFAAWAEAAVIMSAQFLDGRFRGEEL